MFLPCENTFGSLASLKTRPYKYMLPNMPSEEIYQEPYLGWAHARISIPVAPQHMLLSPGGRVLLHSDIQPSGSGVTVYVYSEITEQYIDMSTQCHIKRLGVSDVAHSLCALDMAWRKLSMSSSSSKNQKKKRSKKKPNAGL